MSLKSYPHVANLLLGLLHNQTRLRLLQALTDSITRKSVLPAISSGSSTFYIERAPFEKHLRLM